MHGAFGAHSGEIQSWAAPSAHRSYPIYARYDCACHVWVQHNLVSDSSMPVQQNMQNLRFLDAAAMDADRLKGMSAMAVYYGQPFGRSFSMSVRMMEKSELWRELPAEQHT